MPSPLRSTHLLIQSTARLLLLVVLTVLLSACGGTRVAIPMGADHLLQELPSSGILQVDDRYTVSRTREGRQQINIEHRDASAVIKKPVANTVMIVTTLSQQSSELLIRSDSVGWLWTWRDSARESNLAADLRAWAFARADQEKEAPAKPE